MNKKGREAAGLLALMLALSSLIFTGCKKKQEAVNVSGLNHITTKAPDENAPFSKERSRDLEYTRNRDGTYCLSGIGTCKDTDLVIPAVVSGNLVTNIDDGALEDQTQLTSVEIPDGVTEIGAWAFSGCTGLKTVSVPDSVTSVGICAFSDCSSLAYIESDGAAFLGNKNNPYVILMHMTDPSVTSFTIPDGTKIVYAEAFKDCTALTDIVIPESVTCIGNASFSGCTGLEKIILSDHVALIGNRSFENCTGLITATTGNGIVRLEDATFSGCSALKNVVIGNNVKNIGKDVFSGCMSLVSLTIPFIGAMPTSRTPATWGATSLSTTRVIRSWATPLPYYI